MRRCRICFTGKAPTAMCDACNRSWRQWEKRNNDGTRMSVALWAARRARAGTLIFAAARGRRQARPFVIDESQP